VTWDGRDDAGAEAAPGKYRIRGYAVGDFPVEGLAYGGNDWVQELGAGFPLQEILGVRALNKGSLALLFRQDDGRLALARYEAGQGLRWQQTLEDAPSLTRWHLAEGRGEDLILWRGEEALALNVETGEFLHQGALPAGVEAVVQLPDGKLCWVGNQRGGTVNLLGWREESSFALPFVARQITQSGTEFLALDEGGRLWQGRGDQWQRVPAWIDDRFLSVAAAGEGEFWGLLETDESPKQVRTGLFSTGGEFLKEINPETFPAPPLGVAAGSSGQEIFFLLGDRNRDGWQALWGIRPGSPERAGNPAPDETAATPGWEIFLQKQVAAKIEWPVGFKRLPVRLQLETTNYLQRGRETNTFRLAVRRPDTLQLESAEGLHLADLVRTAPIIQAAARWSPEQPGALRFLVQSRAWTEEFLLTGLEELLALDVADFSWPIQAD
jgi:hypothetical protein